MPFLGLFSRKSQKLSDKRPPSRASAKLIKAARSSTASRSDAASSADDDYVLPPLPSSSSSQDFYGISSSSVTVNPSKLLLSTSSTTLRLVTSSSPSSSARHTALVTESRRDSYQPPPRRSSLFAALDQAADTDRNILSSESLPNPILSTGLMRHPTPPGTSHNTSQSKTLPSPSSKTLDAARSKRPSLFSWATGRDRSKSTDAQSVKSTKSIPDEKQSFNLKSFRHVVPPIPPPVPPLLASNSSPSPSSSRLPPPARTSTVTPTPAFQVTSRPRGNSTLSDASTSPQKVTVGAFRQAARRSATNLPLTPDGSATASPLPSRPSVDDRTTPPSNSLALPALRDGHGHSKDMQPKPSPTTPTPSPRGVSPRPRTRTASSSAEPSQHLRQPALTSLPNGHRLKAVPPPSTSSSTSSSSSSSEAESDESQLERQSTITRRSVLRASYSHSRSDMGHGMSNKNALLPVRQVPSARSDMGHGNLSNPQTSGALNAQHGSLYSRQRASLSTSALPSAAYTARQATLAVANARIKGKERALLPGSDTSEDEDSDTASSDDNAPLSSFANKRPDSKMSFASSSTATPRPSARPLQPAKVEASSKPLIDLDTPSTFHTADKVKNKRITTLARNTSIRSTRSAEDLHEIFKDDDVPTLRPSAKRDMAVRQPRIATNSRSTATTVNPGPRPFTVSFGNDSRPSVSLSSTGQSPASSFQTRSSLAFPPPRPFRESPASSTSNGGDSSSGGIPPTPRDGSDIGSRQNGLNYPGKNLAHRKRASVTFADSASEIVRDKERQPSHSEEESRRRERRRSEAKNAIELGNVVNGPGPIPDPDEDDQPPAMTMPGSGILHYSHPNNSWSAWAPQSMMSPVQMPVNLMPPPQSMMIPPPPASADMNFLAAHQQAMMIAKQTYQMAVAQQAMAAAADEWERSSNLSGMPGSGSVLGWGHSLFPAAAQSMYAGSVIGGSNGRAGWGSSSVYGENFGPSMTQTSMMQQQQQQQQYPLMPSYSSSELPDIGGTRPRQRTKTAPTRGVQTTVPSQSVAPPSSWKGR